MSVTLNLNGKEFGKKISSNLNSLVEAVMRNTQLTIVEGFRKFPKPPIKSGQLRSSIDYTRTGEGTGKIRAKKNYAQYVEYGTFKMTPRPFMRNGVKDSEQKNLEIISKELQQL